MTYASNASLLMDWALKSHWALERDYLDKVFMVLMRHESGERLGHAEVVEITGEARKKPASDYSLSPTGVATIPVHGVISKRASMISDISGPRGTSCEKLRSCIEQAMADKACKSIVFDIDSPGGTVDGTADLCDYIYSCRGKKPMTAFANGMMASAAYWLGSACDKMFVSQDAYVGSIGVYVVRTDYSEALKKEGVKKTLVTSGRFKGINEPGLAVTDDAIKDSQALVDAHYVNFVQAVARNRGMKFSEAAKLADGRCWIGAKAIECGLADAVGTYQSVGCTTKTKNNDTEPEAKAMAENENDAAAISSNQINAMVAKAVADILPSAVGQAVQAAVTQLRAELDPLKTELAKTAEEAEQQRKTMVAQNEASQFEGKKVMVDNFIETRRANGKIKAYQLDETNPQVASKRQFLMELDHTDRTRDKNGFTQLGRAMAMIDAEVVQSPSSVKQGDGETPPSAPKGISAGQTDPRRELLKKKLSTLGHELAAVNDSADEILADFDDGDEEMKESIFNQYCKDSARINVEAPKKKPAKVAA